MEANLPTQSPQNNSGLSFISLNRLNNQTSVIQKVTTLRILFPISPIMQGISMVYKLIKDQSKLKSYLKGKKKEKHPSIFCSENIPGINLYFLIYFFS